MRQPIKAPKQGRHAMSNESSVDLEVLDVKQMVVSSDPAAGAVITLQIAGERIVDLHLPPHALAKLEAFLAKANMEQAKHQPVQ